jgi:class 3 adenylate cyclase/tetratricopeptide (TPR) repeat protein
MSRSVAATTALHPEDAATFVSRLLKAMADAVFKHEGRVDRFLGDGVLAVFGAPLARENDPERAIRAALEIREAANRLGIDAHAGINTGEVYLGVVGSDLSPWMTVMGPVVNLAARLRDNAAAGQILVGEGTYHQTRRAFVFSPVTVELKGIAQPVVAYAVERALPRPKKARGIEGLRAGFVGREEELAKLGAALKPVLHPTRAASATPAVASGGPVILLTGEAGVGKSRLIAEQREAASGEWSVVTGSPDLPPGAEAGRKSGAVLTTQGIPLLWLEGRCFELGTATSPATGAGFSLFVDLIRDYFTWRTGLRTVVGGHWPVIGSAVSPPTGEAPASARSTSEWHPEPLPWTPVSSEELRNCLSELVERGHLSLEQREEVVPLLGSILSLPLRADEAERLRSLSPEQIKHRTMSAICDFMVALARQQPLVLVLEDLHWADSLSLELCSRMMEVAAAAPIALLCISRPEPEQAVRSLEEAAAEKCPERYTAIPLRELGREASRRLVESLLTPGTVPEPMLQVILEKTHGNPFYIEEVVRSLITTGMIYREAREWRVGEGFQPSTVPDTIQSVILSRVDRLPRDLRRVLQRASVIGRAFDPQVLERVLPDGTDLPRALSELEQYGLIQLERPGVVEEYAFRHVLTQETVYEMVLRRQRSELHRQVAETLVLLYPDRQEELAEELARQYSLGGAPAKAIQYLLIAGQKAQRVYANREAIRFFTNALQCLQQLPADDYDPGVELTVREGLGDVLFLTGAHREAEEQFAAALKLAASRDTGDPDATRRLTALSHKLADSVHWQGKWDRAIAIAEEGLALLGEEYLNAEAVNLLEVITRSCWARDDLSLANQYADRIKPFLHTVPYFDSIYMVYYGIAWLEIKLGRFESAEAWLRRMEDLCREHGNEHGLARWCHGWGDLCRARGEFPQAIEWFRRSLQLCEHTEDAHLLLEGHIERAHLLILTEGDPQESDRHIRHGMAIAEEMSKAGRVPSVARLCEHLGKAFLDRGDDERALLYLRRSLEIGEHPTPEQILRELEPLYQRLGRAEEFIGFRRRVRRERSARSDSRHH